MADENLGEGVARILMFRADQNAKNIGQLQEWRASTDRELEKIATQISYLTRAVEDCDAAINRVGVRLLAFAFTIAASAVGLSLTILIGTGKV